MICYKHNIASYTDIKKHFKKCNFIPRLDSYTNVEEYIKKILSFSERFEIWDNYSLIGFSAVYFNNQVTKEGYLTNLSIVPEYTKKGIASNLIKEIFKFGKKNKFLSINLEVFSLNKIAIRFYQKNGFTTIMKDDIKIKMRKTL